MKTTSFAILALVILMSSCKDPNQNRTVMGYRPVYVQTDNIADLIKSGPATPLQNPGKIYTKDQYLYINETGKGIHVINNANPSAPVNIGFINIPFNEDIAIQENTLYADYAGGLLAIDIKNPVDIKVLKFIPSPEPYTITPSSSPNGQKVYFECVDASKGQVVAWEKVEIENPKCFK